MQTLKLVTLPSSFNSKIKEIGRLHSEILGSVRTSVDQAIRVGELLTEIKGALDHGQWGPWMKSGAVGFSEETAQRYMRCFKHKSHLKSVTVTDLASAYKLLSSGNEAHVSNNSGNNEWYTPPEFIEAAKETMGGIDTDPASSKTANKTVGAETFYTAEQDGLKQEWNGRVWLNPPYAQPLISEFSKAVVEKVGSGEIDEACVLVNNATETEWFQNMLAVSSAACFTKSRIKFLDTDGNPSGAPLQGQAILYFGKNDQKFAKHFSKLGEVLQRVI